MSLIKLPILIDPHTHCRDFEQNNKETFETATRAALAGGYGYVADMPNHSHPIVDKRTLGELKDLAEKQIVTDLGIYLGVTPQSVSEAEKNFRECEGEVRGLKIYMGETTGGYIVDSDDDLDKIFRTWESNKPILVHTEDKSLVKALELAEKYKRNLYVCHVSRKDELELIDKFRQKRKNNIWVEVTPHHLFLSDKMSISPFGQMKPPLSSDEDKEALWMAVIKGEIDTIGTDHAPHTREEKMGIKPPSGVPGLETTLVLLLRAEKEGKISREKIIELTHNNPIKIFNLNKEKYDRAEVVLVEEEFLIEENNLKTKCGWTPFKEMRVSHKIVEVNFDGKIGYKDGEILAVSGSGKIV
ncbi:MAG: dihydroorotase family protein [Candidatus Shapirobacteria bacterium]|nr:dihydroorotase family protein [Candidatus Shapirobacteria bacterium]